MNNWNQTDTARVRRALERVHTLSQRDGLSVRGSPKRYEEVLKRDLADTFKRVHRRFGVTSLEYKHLKAAASPCLCCVCKFRFCLKSSACDRCWEAADKAERIKLRLQRTAKTNVARYGRANYFEGQAGIDAVKRHTLEKHGVTNVMHDPEIRRHYDKAQRGVDFIARARAGKRTNQRRYGVDHWSQRPELMERMQSKLLETHGVTNVMHLKKVRRRWEKSMSRIDWKAVYDEKVVPTVQKRFGVDNIFQDVERIEAARLEKTGCVGPWSEGAKKRYAKKTGFDHPLRNPEIRDAAAKTALSRKVPISPKKIIGSTRVSQGYEPQVISFLQGSKNVSEIYTGKLVPRIRWNDDQGKEHYYFPDLLITMSSGKKKLVEVKSTWTLMGNEGFFRANLLKFYAVKKTINYPFHLALVHRDRLFIVTQPYEAMKAAYLEQGEEAALSTLLSHPSTRRLDLHLRGRN